MDQIDIKKLKSAFIYAQRIADGHNPINNLPIGDDTIINDPNVIRCMYFIKEVLQKVYDNNGIIDGVIKKSNKADRNFPYEVLTKFEYREDKGINKLIEQIYEPIAGHGIKNIWCTD